MAFNLNLDRCLCSDSSDCSDCRLWLLVGSDRQTDRQCQLLSCPGQLKRLMVLALYSPPLRLDWKFYVANFLLKWVQMCSNVFKWVQIVQNLFKCYHKCSNGFKLVQNLFKWVQICSNVFICVQTCSKLVQVLLYVFKCVQMCSSVFKCDQTCLKLVQMCWNVFKLVQMCSFHIRSNLFKTFSNVMYQGYNSILL